MLCCMELKSKAPYFISRRALEEKPDLELNKPDKNPNFKSFMQKIEQATYLEWLNRKFQDEFNPNNKEAKSCQDCHMPGEIAKGSKSQRCQCPCHIVLTVLGAILSLPAFYRCSRRPRKALPAEGFTT